MASPGHPNLPWPFRVVGDDRATKDIEFLDLLFPLTSTKEIQGKEYRLIEEGAIDAGELADGSVDEDKLNGSVAGAGLTGGAGTPLAVGAGHGLDVAADAVDVDETELTARSIPGVEYDHGVVTALPGSPEDGDRCTYTDSLTSPTYAWELRRFDSDWWCTGGSPITSSLGLSESDARTSYQHFLRRGSYRPDHLRPSPRWRLRHRSWLVDVQQRRNGGCRPFLFAGRYGS